MMHELDDPIEVDTPLGRGYAHPVEGESFDTCWTVIIKTTRAIVIFRPSELWVAPELYPLGDRFSS